MPVRVHSNLPFPIKETKDSLRRERVDVLKVPFTVHCAELVNQPSNNAALFRFHFALTSEMAWNRSDIGISGTLISSCAAGT